MTAKKPSGTHLNDLRVIDLKLELERRSLDTKGVKKELTERLSKALIEEGHDPDEYLFDLNTEKKVSTRKKDELSADDSVTEKAGKGERVKENGDLEEKDADDEEQGEQDKSEMPEVKDGDSKSKACNENIKEEQYEEVDNADEEEGEYEEKEEEGKGNEAPQNTEKSSASEKSVAPKKDVSSEKSSASQAAVKTERKSSAETEQNKESKEVASSKGTADDDDSIMLNIEEDEKLLLGEEDADSEKTQKNKDEEGRANTSASKEEAREEKEESSKSESDGKKNVGVEEKGDEENQNSQRSETEPGEIKTDSNEKKDSAASKNLWISGLSSATRATDLKQIFSKYGKVIGAKIVTNARTPGARCYGYVTMLTNDDATKCIQHLHRTELHGRMISVERAKSDVNSGRPKPSVADDKKREHATKPRIDDKSRREHEERKKREEKRKKEAEEKAKEAKKAPASETAQATSTEKVTGLEAPGTESAEGGEADAESVKNLTKKPSEELKRASSSGKVSTSGRTSSSGRRSSSGQHSASKHASDVLTFAHIKGEREKQKLRDQERMKRDEERRHRLEKERQREISRKQREEAVRLEREREKLRIEREKIERERAELLRLEREAQKLERERLQREKEELKRVAAKLEDAKRTVKRAQSRSSPERIKKPRDNFERREPPRYNERIEEKRPIKRPIDPPRPSSDGKRPRDTRYERPESSRYSDRFDRPERPDRSDHRPPRSDRPPRSERSERSERSDRAPRSFRSGSREDRRPADRGHGSGPISRSKPEMHHRNFHDRKDHAGDSSSRYKDNSRNDWGSNRGGPSSGFANSSSNQSWMNSTTTDSRKDNSQFVWNKPMSSQSTDRWPSGAPMGMSRNVMSVGNSAPFSSSMNSDFTGGMPSMMNSSPMPFPSDRFDAYKNMNTHVNMVRKY